MKFNPAEECRITHRRARWQGLFRPKLFLRHTPRLYSVKPTDMMTAQRFITIKENPKTTYANITLSNLELIALLNYPYIDKFPGLREKLNKGLKETS